MEETAVRKTKRELKEIFSGRASSAIPASAAAYGQSQAMHGYFIYHLIYLRLSASCTTLQGGRDAMCMTEDTRTRLLAYHECHN
jgi:hypothetical protein